MTKSLTAMGCRPAPAVVSVFLLLLNTMSALYDLGKKNEFMCGTLLVRIVQVMVLAIRLVHSQWTIEVYFLV
jgi:hypothetical protein